MNNRKYPEVISANDLSILKGTLYLNRDMLTEATTKIIERKLGDYYQRPKKSIPFGFELKGFRYSPSPKNSDIYILYNIES